jgi:hypothetical protein
MSAFTPIDHTQIGLSRVATQFREKVRFLAWLTAILEQANDIENALASMNLANIDLMEGVNLDVIGIIVGVSRIVPNVVTSTWFGFEDTGTWATPFGEESQPSIGSRFYEESESIYSTTLLQDPEYRLILKARIVKNNSASTPEDIIAGLRFIFNTQDVKYSDVCTDGYDGPAMSFSIAVGREIYAFEQAIITALDILPRPAGMNIHGAVGTFDPPGDGYTGGTEGENF